MATITTSNILFHPYSQRYRLPGDKANYGIPLKRIGGVVRRGVVHALTFHGVPPLLDQHIDRLPRESIFLRTAPIQRDFLNFTVYSLKQMVANGTIEPETAWQLFYQTWDEIDQVDEYRFSSMRGSFWQRVQGEMNVPFANATDPLLAFEFYARAGEAGLRDIERYSSYAQELVFDEETCGNMSPPVREEYAKALWLEMRLVEAHNNLYGINRDIKQFTLSRYPNDTETSIGSYSQIDRRVKAWIQLFPPQRATQNIPLGTVDDTLKSEVGHWLFGQMQVTMPPDNLCELQDRQNMSGYTPRVAREYAAMQQGDQIVPTPETRAFLTGGNFLTDYFRNGGEKGDLEAGYPIYPGDFPNRGKVNFYDRHQTAEYLDREIRRGIVEAVERGIIEPNQIYSIYKQVGLYLALLDLGRNCEYIFGLSYPSREDLLRIVRNLPDHLKTILNRVKNWERDYQRLLLDMLTAWDVGGALPAILIVADIGIEKVEASMREAFGGAIDRSLNDERTGDDHFYTVLRLIKEKQYVWARPSLERCISYSHRVDYIASAAGAWEALNLGAFDNQHLDYLQVLIYFSRGDTERILQLGEIVLPALRRLATCRYIDADRLVETIGGIGGLTARKLLEDISKYFNYPETVRQSAKSYLAAQTTNV